MAVLSTSPLFTYSRLSIEEVCNKLQCNTEGLTEIEAAKRLQELGSNNISANKQKSEILELLFHFRSPLVIILLVASIISFSMGETTNAMIIFFMVLMSVIIDYFQERDARNAADRLKETVINKVSIFRNGTTADIPSEKIVPGDIVMLSSGKIVPADGRVIQSRDFFVNQSSLTGESFPSEKHSLPIVNAGETLTELDNIVFMGSSVITGSANMVVISTGMDTEFGKIAQKLIIQDQETDFSKGIRSFGYLIMRVTIVLVLFIFLINAFLKHNLLESFMFSLAVAVGLTPELLPMIMSVTMAKGSLRMAKKGAVVKKLSAIPNFGSMDVLCTDKTGTITEDKIKLIQCLDIYGTQSDELFLYAYLNSYFQTGIQNPLDQAILQYRQPDVSIYSKFDEIPFDFVRKRMSIVVDTADRRFLICKGAPEEILKACIIEKEQHQRAEALYEKLSADGFRVLAVATKIVPEKEIYSKSEESELEMKGFVAFLDPPKEDADETIAALGEIGVEVKIITGDNHLVTQKICKEIGLPVKGVMQGYELEHLTDDALQNKVMGITIFSRFSPDQKNRVIIALKQFHHAVGYLGDGINDAPSLKTADVGISVNSATDVAKDAADIILTEKDLLILKDGILEGRRTFGNTMKYILMGLSSNFGNMFSVAAATLFLPFLPMLPSQILINNFLYDTSQITIPTDKVDANYMKRPQRWNFKMIYYYMLIFGLTSSIFDFLTFYILYKVFAVNEAQFHTGWFMESLATQILVVFIIRTAQIPFIQSRPGKYLVLSVLICLGVGWVLPYTPFAELIGFVPLPRSILLVIIILVITYLGFAELVKRFIYHRLHGV